MAPKKIQLHDLVWAKREGSVPWPGVVAIPPASKTKPKKNHHYVYFYGLNIYLWVADKDIQLHSEELVKKHSNKKECIYQFAIKNIIACSREIAKYPKPDEILESEAEEQRNNLEKIPNIIGEKHKTKNLQSNSTPSKKMKKLSSVKELSLEKKTARASTSHSSQGVLDPVPSGSSIIEEDYPELMSNVPPNLDYHCLSEPILNILERKNFDFPDAPPVDVSYQSEFVKKKVIEPINRTIGFLGLDKISQDIVKNMCQSAYSVIIWSQIRSECKEFAKKCNNVKIARCPADVLEGADIIFSFVSDEDVAKQIMVDVLKELERSGDQKGYVEMTTVDPKVSLKIASEIRKRGGLYLEAPLCGSRGDANEGTLFIFTSGDETLYNDCKIYFDVISKAHKFVSTNVGGAYNMGLIRSMLMSTVCAAVAESLALISKIGLKGDFVIEVIKAALVNNENIVPTTRSMLNNGYIGNALLKQMQKDLRLGCLLGDQFSQPTPIFATVKEAYKCCMPKGYGDHNVYEANKS